VTTNRSIDEEPRSRMAQLLVVREVLLRCHSEVHSWHCSKKKGRKRSFLPGPEASSGVSCR
jgi:hypothetical protein